MSLEKEKRKRKRKKMRRYNKCDVDLRDIF
jgi:hypothetical protein